MSEEDINFLISIQDLEQPEFDNACLERENERLNNIIKDIREEMENAKHISVDDSKAIIKHEKRILEILNKEVNND